MADPVIADQYDATGFDKDVNISSATRFGGQTFIAGSSYNLVKAGVFMYKETNFPINAEAKLEIYQCNTSHEPEGDAIGYALLPSADIPLLAARTMVDFDFTMAVTIIAGKEYAVILGWGDTGNEFGSLWPLSTTNSGYIGAQAFTTDDQASWGLSATNDIPFRTYSGDLPEGRIVIAENLQNATQQTAINNNTARTGNSFDAAESAAITEVMFFLNHGGGVGDLIASIWECDESYEPIGDPIAVSEARSTVGLMGIGHGIVNFTFDGSVQLVQGNKYAVAFQLDAVGGQTGVGIWTGAAFTPGVLVTSTDSGESWTSNSAWDVVFGVYGSVGGAGGGGGGNIPTDVALFESWGF